MQAYESDTDSYIMGRNEQARQALLKSLIDASFESLNINVIIIRIITPIKKIIIQIIKIRNKKRK